MFSARPCGHDRQPCLDRVFFVIVVVYFLPPPFSRRDEYSHGPGHLLRPRVFMEQRPPSFSTSSPFLTAFFLLQERFTKMMSVGSYLGMCALSIGMFISVSLNETLILCIFIFGYQVFLSGGLKEKSVWLLLSALACGMAAAFPDTLFFLQAAFRSIRRFAENPAVSLYWSNKIFWTPVAAAGIYSPLFFGKDSTASGRCFLAGGHPVLCGFVVKGFAVFMERGPVIGRDRCHAVDLGGQIFS